jgi:two-component system CheB/CheR fusion protein
MGIGLTLVRSIVLHHGGNVRAISEGPGHGSEFIVTLPMADVATIAAARSAATPVPPRAPIAPKRILIVDDNRDLAESLAALLRLSKHEVAVASDGQAALQMVKTLQPDLALIDISLPGMSGYEVARGLRARGCSARLVAVTGYGGSEERQRSLDAGFDDHFVKPLDPAAIDNLIFSTGEDALSTE